MPGSMLTNKAVALRAVRQADSNVLEVAGKAVFRSVPLRPAADRVDPKRFPRRSAAMNRNLHV